MTSLLKRYEKNPILTVDDLPPGVGFYILNPGAVKYNGEYLLLVDVFHREGGIILWIARSKNGYDFKFDPAPVDWPKMPEFYCWQEHGCYDPRITKMGDEYFIFYGSHNNDLGTRIALVKTRDFMKFEHVALTSELNNRNAALFPEKINGMYCRFERPFSGDEFSPCYMWMSFSRDLEFWGRHLESIKPRPCHWDHQKIGAGAPPIRIKEGWLEIYHGVNPNCSGSTYMLYAAILDYKEPWKVIARSKYPLLFPETEYEKNGRVRNVVFTCNAILEENGMVKVYYGAADSCIGLAEAPLEEIVKSCYEPYKYTHELKER
ncbi:MAG: glycoside hydrolase family 130 protein [Lentisphaeria bacterium]|nr:glycoside hydrolase family 130 protein [Lentisphaeria bacterium]